MINKLEIVKIVELSLVLFQLRLETNTYVSMKINNRDEISCRRELRREVNCVIVARIRARRRSIRESDVIELLKARALMFLIDWLTRKVEKSVIDCKEIEFEVFELFWYFVFATNEIFDWLKCKLDRFRSDLIWLIKLKWELWVFVEFLSLQFHRSSYEKLLTFYWVELELIMMSKT